MHATALLLIGAQLARSHGGVGSGALLDVWISGVMPLVVERGRYGVDNDDEGCPGETALLYAPTWPPTHSRTEIPEEDEPLLGSPSIAHFHAMMQTTGMMSPAMMEGLMGSDSD